MFKNVARIVPVRTQSSLAAQPGRAVQHSYFVPRNSQGSMPVYTDTRMNNKFCTLIRNVQGNADDLARDIQAGLFPAGTPEASRVAVATVRGRHVVLTGGHWKREVVQWLQSRGF